MELRMLFGRRLRVLRKQKGWTQEQLGEYAEASGKFLGSVERGKENPSIEFVAKLADALGIPMRDLFDFEHELTDAKELRDQINTYLEEANIEELQTISRIIRTIVR